MQSEVLLGAATVRPMEPTDAEACSALDPVGLSPAIFQERLAGSCIGYVVELDGEIVCFALFRLLAEGEVADMGKLVNSQRGAPLGKALLGHMRLKLKALGVRQVVSRCDATMVRYYKSVGGVVTGKLPNFYAVGHDAVAMSCEL